MNKIKTLIKTKRNRKWKIPHTVLGRRTLCFVSYKNGKLKKELWSVGARERKKKAFFVPFILSEGQEKHYFTHFFACFLKSSNAFSVSLGRKTQLPTLSFGVSFGLKTSKTMLDETLRKKPIPIDS